MTETLFKKILLPKDAGPHALSNIEWWYFFSYLTGDKGGHYAAMASFFRVGEVEFFKGQYLIFTLIDLETETRQNFSLIDSNLKRVLISMYLPFHLLQHPLDINMWKLFKSLSKGQIPFPHSRFKKAKIKHNPTRLIYGENSLKFFGKREDSFEVNLIEENVKLNLQFTPLKPVALIGGDGKPNNLYYYSFTQNSVQGKIKTGRGTENVRGQGWFDHQWGRDYRLLTGYGWNWFGLQLKDSRQLLLQEARSNIKGNTFSPMANLIEEDGLLRFTEDVSFTEIKYWQSPKTGATYPVEWKICIPQFLMELQVTATFPEQEMPIIGPLQGIWEGTCNVTGSEMSPCGQTKPLNGKGFMELVGYAYSAR